MLKNILISFLLPILLLCAHFSYAAGDGAVAQVVVLMPSNLNAYKETLKGYKQVIARVAPEAKLKVYKANYAGEKTGAVYAIVEYPNMEYLAKYADQIDNDPEWHSLGKKAPPRKVLSYDLWVDITPD
jgi:hypothetical protein